VALVQALSVAAAVDHGAGGGGWDTTARAFQDASRSAGLDEGIEVFNVEGAGDPYQLMVTGLVMLGAIETNGSDVPRTTPIATLITETEAIVVPGAGRRRSRSRASTSS
jgi:tripartite-type tricarboxylate transporter receptor subunit TctC